MVPLPHQILLLGAALLALGGVAGPVLAFGLPRGNRFRRGGYALLPQATATLGAALCVAGWALTRRAVETWQETTVMPAPALKTSLDMVIAWKDRFGLGQAVFILICLVLAALPIWRGQVTEKL